jgi:hypothetical protein
MFLKEGLDNQQSRKLCKGGLFQLGQWVWAMPGRPINKQQAIDFSSEARSF